MDDCVFALRGNSLTPWRLTEPTDTYVYSNNHAGITAPAVVPSSDPGIIGGGYIALANASIQKALYWVGVNNFSTNKSFSVVVRVVMRYSGTPSSNQGFFEATRPHATGRMIFGHLTTDKMHFAYNSRNNTGIMNRSTTASWSPVAGTVYDLCLTYNDDTKTINFYIDGVLFDTSTVATGTDHDLSPFCYILIGTGGTYTAYGNYDVNEAAAFNYVIDPTPSGLNLIGASRTDFIDVESSDGSPTSGGGSGAVSLGSIRI